MTESLALELKNISKTYGHGRTAKTALDGLNLTVFQGEVFGFLGPNGSGKTTTIRILLDLLRPNAGEVRVLGVDPCGGVDLRRDIGYLPGDFIVNGKQTGRELLTHLGDLRGGVPASRISELAERFELDLTRRISSLSKGNRQKVGLVQAFMHRPKLLILDEPTSGLDPFLQQQFVVLAQESKANKQTVFMSSHVMSEVQHTCDRVGIIRDGKLVAVEGIDALRERSFRHVQIRFAAPVEASDFSQLTGVTELSIDGTLLRCRLTGEADALIKTAAKHTVLDLRSEEPELEELFFMYYTRSPGQKSKKEELS